MVQNELCVPGAIICSGSGVFGDFMSKYVHQLPEKLHFHFFREVIYFLPHVRESRFDFPLQNLSFIKYLDGKWGTFWAFRYKRTAYF